MAQQTINVGTAPNDGTGTPLRTAFQYTNSNFSELYTAVGPSGNNIVVPGSATITGDLTAARLNVTGATVPANGVYLVATNKIAFSTNSTKRFTIDDFGNLLNSTTATQNGFLQFDNSIDGGTLGYVGNAKALISGGSTSSVGIRGESSVQFAIGSNLGMTLNSTGLGVGASPSALLHVQKSQNSETTAIINNTNTGTSAGVRLDLQSNGSNYLTLQSYGQNYSGNAFGIAAAKLNVVSENSATAFSSGLAIGTTSSNPLYFATSNAVKMTLDSSGNVGIGVTPSAWSTLVPALQLGGGGTFLAARSTNPEMYIGTNAHYNGANWIYKTSAAASKYSQDTGAHRWFTAPSGTAGNAITFTQAMTLDASGRLVLGTTGAYNAARLTVQSAGGAGGINTSIQNDDDSYYAFNFRNSSGVSCGSISCLTSSTAFNTSSDYRLKEAVQPIIGALSRVSALKPSIYKWKVDGSSGEGFLAHELAEVVPSAVTGEKDAVNEDGSIKPQQVDLSKVIPVLVAAIKELAAEVNALKNA